MPIGEPEQVAIYPDDQDLPWLTGFAAAGIDPSTNRLSIVATQFTATDRLGMALPTLPADYRKPTSIGLVKTNTPDEFEFGAAYEGDRIEQTGRVVLKKLSSAARSELPVERVDWRHFKEAVSQLPRNLVFRGQSSSWRLRTSFHRQNRANLSGYFQIFLRELAIRINSVSSYKYDLSKIDDISALLALAQHHNYPTPLLDWTKSPYIAAYFAIERQDTENPRVIAFDQFAWLDLQPDNLRQQMFSQAVESPFPRLQVFQPLSPDNPRTDPQQSMVMYSSIDDIETYLQGQSRDVTLLRVFELDGLQREEVLYDLGLMGITPATMFPGIEGVCADLKLRHFGSGRGAVAEHPPTETATGSDGDLIRRFSSFLDTVESPRTSALSYRPASRATVEPHHKLSTSSFTDHGLSRWPKF